MPTFKCKMCGGALEIENDASIATCEYCGITQTLPRIDDEKRANMYDRANHFRRNNEFDKAMGIYEQILSEDNTDAEAYWSLVLCSYGIEYVEDPKTHKRVPTVNRAQFTSVFDDDNYKSALRYADGYQKSIYVEEARAINEIQKGILAISQKEEPFDVFICYKETDNNGSRTPDSVLANDLYHQLTHEGFKVFFARITLEDKLGSAYEPYIFAALNSAKVMVVLGTKPEFFNAVWVKNEWSRYLALVKNSDGKKMLIPAYKNMDPYDLPEEFSHLQAQDMSKLGFMQDLIRGIKKITQSEASKTTVIKETVIANGNANTVPLLKRAFMFLEDGDWDSANEYCEKVLDIDPENASAYLGKLLADLKVKNRESLKNEANPFDNNANYRKAIRFGDEELKTTLAGYIKDINTRNKNIFLGNVYNNAKESMAAAKTEDEYKEAANLFESIGEYLDSKALAQKCYKEAEMAKKDPILAEAKAKMALAERRTNMNLMNRETISTYACAIRLFRSISGWKDADEKCYACEKKLAEVSAKVEKNRKKRIKRVIIITALFVCAIVAYIVANNIRDNVIIPNKYNDAMELMDAGNLDEAYRIFTELGDYKDAADKANDVMDDIIEKEHNDFLDSEYNDAMAMMNEGNIIEAYETLVKLDGYKDSEDKANSIYDKYKMEKLKVVEAGDYVFFGAYEQDNNTSNGKEKIEWLVLEVKEGKALVISKDALDCKQYNTSDTDITWETCTLREWLNNDFINAAFSEEEGAVIPTVTVSADNNPDYGTNPGNATQDRVFLLSITEANKYFSSDSERQCEPTDYAVANGAYSINGNCCWWLRSPGDIQDSAACVSYFGVVYEFGDFVYNGIYAVRPALWIDLNS